jgi:hypothetical protein
MVPPLPTTTKRLLAKAMPYNRWLVPELRLVQLMPSGEVRMVPPLPTATKRLLAVAGGCSGLGVEPPALLRYQTQPVSQGVVAEARAGILYSSGQ